MIEHKEHFHGSDLEKIEKVFGIKKEDIISFSANVNPLGISEHLKKVLCNNIDIISSYPDREYTALKAAISSYANCASEKIVLANGATELISLFVGLTSPKHALILGPSYSEYEHEVKKCGGVCEYFMLKSENDFELNCDELFKALGYVDTNSVESNSVVSTSTETNAPVDLLIICNPNNPTGTAIEASVMENIISFCAIRGIFVMVDETYVEFCEDVNAISCVPLTSKHNNLVVLRGTSKFFAAPGLRLGYAVLGSDEIIASMNEKINAWSINSIATLAGETMFSDNDYIQKTRSLISEERDKYYKLFSKSSRFKPYKPAANFMLMEIVDDTDTSNSTVSSDDAIVCDNISNNIELTSEILFERCIRKGLMIRDCSTFAGLSNKFIRFCFMKPEDNARLAEMLLK